MASTITIQSTIDWARTYPSLTPVLGNPVAGYGGNAVALRIANKVIQEILQEPCAWKWNRTRPTGFYLNGLQQDYSTSITNLGWLENAIRIQTDDPQYTYPSPSDYPIRGIEAVRELLPTSIQGIPQQICWIENSEAICGKWNASVLYTNPAGLQAMPQQPLTQIRDSNGNIQVVTTYGTTGATAPTWPASGSTPGTTTQDGSVVWTLVDPNGITFRLSPRPANSGIPYLIQPFYQNKPTTFTKTSQVWTVPDELSGLYEQGFLAYSWDASENDQNFEEEYAAFQLRIRKAIGASAREQESFCAFPGRSLTGVTGFTDRGDQQYPPGLFTTW